MTEHKHRRHITIDPAVQSGTPCLDGTRIPAAQIATAFDCGFSVEAIGKEYPGVDRAAVLVCCWYLATYGNGAWRKQWGKWAKKAHDGLWDVINVDVADIELPPQKEQK